MFAVVLAKNSVFLENNRVGGRPLPYFERAELKKKGFLWSFWVQNLFSWYFCAYTIGYRYAGVQHCSVAPPHNRQKYSKIGCVPGFSDGLGESSGGKNPPYPYFGARESQQKGNFCRKSSIGRYSGVQHCSAGPAQSRQKYPKIGQISGFLIFLDKSHVGGPPPYFGAGENKKKCNFPRKSPFC